MDMQGNSTLLRKASTFKFHDQQFLINFIMGTYLGPDLYSDIPRCSAFQRLAKGSPPYTSNNLGTSFLSISQLESSYYYVLRNAHPDLVLKPNMLYMYLKGKLNLLDFGMPDDHSQFTSIFPSNLHDHKRYSASYEIVKGIVLIDDPTTSYMKKEDLERFKYLSSMDDLKLVVKECLSYQHGYLDDGEETKVYCTMDGTTGTSCNESDKSFQFCGKKYKKRCRDDPIKIPAFPDGVSMSKQHMEESSFQMTYKLDGPARMPVVGLPKLEDCIWDEAIILTGTARRGIAGPPIGVVDIGISKAAYLFQVALPGVRRDFCQLSCEVESGGKVHIQGSTAGGRTIKKRTRVFEMKYQRLCPAGSFTISFNLPGPVDPRLFWPNFRDDGIFEGVIVKQR